MNSLDGGQYGRIIGGIIELIASNDYSDGNGSHTWWAKSKNGWHLILCPTDCHCHWIFIAIKWLMDVGCIFLNSSLKKKKTNKHVLFKSLYCFHYPRLHKEACSPSGFQLGILRKFMKWENRSRSMKQTHFYSGPSGWAIWGGESEANTGWTTRSADEDAHLD